MKRTMFVMLAYTPIFFYLPAAFDLYITEFGIFKMLGFFVCLSIYEFFMKKSHKED